jgi:hypothetical protein
MIKFQKHYVTNGTDKARVSYSSGEIFANVKLGAAGGLRKCVTLYAKDYKAGRLLGPMFENYQNDTDICSDYFETGRVRLFPGDAMYDAALARCAA